MFQENVCDLAAALQRSSPQETLNEHQSKGKRGSAAQQAQTLIIPQWEVPQRWVAQEKKGLWYNKHGGT